MTLGNTNSETLPEMVPPKLNEESKDEIPSIIHKNDDVISKRITVDESAEKQISQYSPSQQELNMPLTDFYAQKYGQNDSMESENQFMVQAR